MEDPGKGFTAGGAAYGNRESVIAELRRRFPRAAVWFGERTGSWWAFTPGHPRFVEARTPAELSQLLTAVAGQRSAAADRPSPRPPAHEMAAPARPRYPRPRPTGPLAMVRASGGMARSFTPTGHRLPRRGLRGRLAELGRALVGGLVVRE